MFVYTLQPCANGMGLLPKEGLGWVGGGEEGEVVRGKMESAKEEVRRKWGGSEVEVMRLWAET